MLVKNHRVKALIQNNHHKVFSGVEKKIEM